MKVELRMAPFYHRVSLCSDRSSGASMDAKHSLEHFTQHSICSLLTARLLTIISAIDAHTLKR